MRTTARRGRTSGHAVATLLLVVVLGACTGDGGSPPPDQPADHVALELSMGPGATGLSTEARDQLQNDVGAVLSTYVVDAYLGDYPRDDFADALDSFSKSFTDRAATHLELLTGAGFGEGVESVSAARLSASIASFVPQEQVVGATAIVDFAFDVQANGTTSEITRQGRLMLMPEDGKWKIFGFELTPEGDQ
jgi:hypothetical protein